MATSLLDWIIDLMRDGSAREVFNTNPQAAMTAAGFTNVCGDDVSDSRAFLFDNPSIVEVKGVDTPQDDADAPDQIKYIVNNYTYEAPSMTPEGPDDVVDVPEDDGTEIDQSDNEGGTNTATVSEDETTKEANAEADEGNAVSGDHSAGNDQISGTLENFGEGISGDGNINVLTLADVVDIDDSPFLDHVVDDSLNGSLNDVIHVLDVLP